MADKSLVLATPEVLLPVLGIEEAIARRKNFSAYVSKLLVEDLDYGNVGQGKPALKKPGAEKLATFFGLTVVLSLIMQIYDWLGDDHGGQPFFAFTYHAHVTRQGIYLAEADGHCNSWEKRYRYIWVNQDQVPPGYDVSLLLRRESTLEEFQFAVNKKETGGQYGKPAEYWQKFEDALRNGGARHGMKMTADGRSYPSIIIPSVQIRLPNQDPYDAVNSCMKIAHKRAYVAAVLIATNASDYFSQDLDDDVALPGVAQRPAAPAPASEQAAASAAPAASQAAAPATSAAPPPAEQVPPQLEAIFKRMVAGTREQRLAEFAAMKKSLRELHGDEAGDRIYYGTLKQVAGVEHSSGFTSLQQARNTIAALYAAVAEGAHVEDEEEPEA